MRFSTLEYRSFSEAHLGFTCSPVATASTLFQSHVCVSEITPAFTSKAMNTACLKKLTVRTLETHTNMENNMKEMIYMAKEITRKRRKPPF